jgi:hypothetical protein
LKMYVIIFSSKIINGVIISPHRDEMVL